MQLSILQDYQRDSAPGQRSPKDFDADRVWRRMSLEPRAWQREALPAAVDAIHEQWQRDPLDDEVTRPLVQAIMGAGKSIFIASVVHAALDMTDDPIVVTAPRKMLVKQLSATLSEMLPAGSVGTYYSVCKQPSRRVVVSCDASVGKLARSLGTAGRQVGLWIADECHGSEADRMKEWVELAGPKARLGLTATPRRASEKQALTLWSKEIYRYDASRALRDGVVVPFDLRHWHGDPETELDDAIAQMIHQVVQQGVGPGVVDANSIDDAQAFAWRLNEEGIRAGVVHCNIPYGQMQRTLQMLQLGKLDVVVHVSILKEGVDLPWLRWLGLRRQVTSKVYFAQHVGRVLRADEGKVRAVILDPGDLFSQHKLNLEAILECDVEEPDPEEEAPVQLRVIEGGAGKATDELPEMVEMETEPRLAVSMDSDLSTLRHLLVELQTQGFAQPGYAGDWRFLSPSTSQIQTVERFVQRDGRRLLSPLEQAPAMRRLYRRLGELNKGQVSDLISVCFGLDKRDKARRGGRR